jgi:hypothetical protein
MNPLWLPQYWGRRKNWGTPPDPRSFSREEGLPLCTPHPLLVNFLAFLGKIFSEGSRWLAFAFLYKGDVFFILTESEVI